MKKLYFPLVVMVSLVVLVSIIITGQAATTDLTDSSEIPRITFPFDPVVIDLDSPRKELENTKLDTRLNQLVEIPVEHKVDWINSVDTTGLIFDGNKILVEIRTDDSQPLITGQFLESERVILRHNNAPGLYEAWVEVTALERVSRNEYILFIRPARLAQTTAGDSLSQGVARSFANEWHTAGVDGTGVTIAIIDAFNNTSGQVAALQASGDWPSGAQLTTVKVGGGIFGDNGNPHGNAVLEIAYDMAPGATFIAYDTLTVGDWYDAIGLAVAAGADIISFSLGAPQDGIGDGSALPGSIAEAATDARSNGILVIKSAGNSRERHWGGLFNSHATITNTHDWGVGSNLNLGLNCLPNGFRVSIDLFWDDWTNVDHDYDLYLYRYDEDAEDDWAIVASSENRQDGSPGQTPQEEIRVQLPPDGTRPNPYGCPDNTHVVGVEVVRWDAPTNRNLQLFTNFNLQVPVHARSLTFPADSPSVLAVAAVDVTSLAQEPYSSEGPILAPGGGLPTGNEHPKPDVASYANVDTESYGPGAFNGTSAAAPHLAGWAALILENNPTFEVDDLEAEIISIASGSTDDYDNDLGDPGHDFQYGYGLTRFLSTPKLDLIIHNPLTSNPGYAGPHDNANKFIVRTNKPENGLTASDFPVLVGGVAANVVTVYEGSEEYVLEVLPPNKPANGLYDLSVAGVVESDAVLHADTNNVDVSLVIDRSGSMGFYEYMEPAKDAAKLFTNLMKDDDQLAVVTFDTTAEVPHIMAPLNPTSRAAAIQAIDGITPRGLTTIGGGLQEGQNQLLTHGQAIHPWAIVLLSDGQENRAPFVQDVLPAIAASKTVVHTVAMGPESDQTLLLNIAAQTGGTYNFVPGAEGLEGIYNTISAKVSNQQTLLAVTDVIAVGMTSIKNVIVDSTIGEATFSISWGSFSAGIELFLVDPNGNVIDPGVAGTNNDIIYTAGDNFIYYRIKTPTLTPGVWQIVISGGALPANLFGSTSNALLADETTYTLNVTGEQNGAAVTLNLYLDQASYAIGDPVKVSATLSDDQPILDAEVIALVGPVVLAGPPDQAPGLTTEDGPVFMLYDDGAHGDGQANDGVYANTLSGSSITEAGVYDLRVFVTGTANNGEAFSRLVRYSISVGLNPDSFRQDTLEFGHNIYLPLAVRP